MADQKISQLTAATTPLAGTEVLPIVQSSTTVKATIANVQAAPVAAGTAYGVQQLNSSKVPTTNSNFLTDGAGNITLGDTLRAWYSGYNSVSMALGYGAVAGDSNNGATEIVENAYAYGNNQWKFISGGTFYATRYRQLVDGSHAWYVSSASGSGGNVITWTQVLGTSSAGNVTVNTGNLVIGTSGKGISLPGGITWTSGSGSPEGVVTAPVGSLYSRSDGGVLTSLYVKQSGSGNTGWAGK